MPINTCELCAENIGEILWEDDFLRVVLAQEAGYAGFCRVVLRRHQAEMSDLAAAERARLMAAVWALERVLRDHYRPAKINLASLGNLVPHLHWHVIPRFHDDPHFPSPVWAEPVRPASPRPVVPAEVLRPALAAALAEEYLSLA